MPVKIVVKFWPPLATPGTPTINRIDTSSIPNPIISEIKTSSIPDPVINQLEV